MKSPLSDQKPLSFGYLTLWGLGGLAAFYSSIGVQALATPVYQMTLGIDPAWLGVALMVPRFLDAFIDPLVGSISDNTHSRFGRRRPYIVVGALVMALAFGFIWMVPSGWSHSAQLTWFITSSVVFYFWHSIYTVPLQSLSYEISADYHERTRVQGFGAFFNRLGELTYSWIFPLSQLAFFASPMVGVRTVAWAVAIFFIAIPGVTAGIIGRERFARITEHQSKVRFWPTVRAALQNRAFCYLITIVIMTYLAGMLASSMDYYLLVYYVCGGDLVAGSFWKGVLSSSYGVVGIISIPVLTWVARRIGKENTMIAVLGLLIFGACARWWIFRPGANWLIMIDPVLGGGALWAAMGMMVQSMVADICDEDELASGQRREGLFGAVFSWLMKTGTSLSFLITGVVLKWVGFDSALKASQAPATFTGMRIFLSFAPVIAALVCIVLLKRYPLTPARAALTRKALEARRGAV